MPSERSRYARSLKLPKTSDSASVPRSTGESGQIVPRALSSWGSVKQTPRAEYRLLVSYVQHVREHVSHSDECAAGEPGSGEGDSRAQEVMGKGQVFGTTWFAP
eukprot:3140238-Rhodomonas_salina.1